MLGLGMGVGHPVGAEWSMLEGVALQIFLQASSISYMELLWVVCRLSEMELKLFYL